MKYTAHLTYADIFLLTCADVCCRKVCALVTDEMYRTMSLLLQKREDRRREVPQSTPTHPHKVLTFYLVRTYSEHVLARPPTTLHRQFSLGNFSCACLHSRFLFACMFRRVQCEDFVGVGGEVSDLLATQQKEYQVTHSHSLALSFYPQVPPFVLLLHLQTHMLMRSCIHRHWRRK